MVDQQKVEQAVRLLLEGIGEDPERAGLVETPARVARMPAAWTKMPRSISREPSR